MLLVMVALEEELSRQPLPAGVVLVHSGVGKVNAALATAEALREYAPSLVVNFGTAGALSPAAHGLVEVGCVVQRDMQAEPLAPRGTTPFDPRPPELANGRTGLRCATGDSFVTAADAWLTEHRIDLVDMELWGIAMACERAGCPWRAWKYLTDKADEAAAGDWQAKVGLGEQLFLARLAELLAGPPGCPH
jgi:adenosylhomocysteine nucleosidase